MQRLLGRETSVGGIVASEKFFGVSKNECSSWKLLEFSPDSVVRPTKHNKAEGAARCFFGGNISLLLQIDSLKSESESGDSVPRIVAIVPSSKGTPEKPGRVVTLLPSTTAHEKV